MHHLMEQLEVFCNIGTNCMVRSKFTLKLKYASNVHASFDGKIQDGMALLRWYRTIASSHIAAGCENHLVGEKTGHMDRLVDSLARLLHSHRHFHPLDHPSHHQGTEAALDLVEDKGRYHGHHRLALHGWDILHLGSHPVGTCSALLVLGALHSDGLAQLPLVDGGCS